MPSIPERALRPYWQTKDQSTILYQGHAPSVLKRMPENSVQMCVTSPPYWRLRDYKTDNPLELGSEDTVEEFVANLVEVFRGVKRVLRPDGTCWINLGDTFLKGDLVGVPWLVAQALKRDGWILRQDIVWHKPSAMPQPCEDRCTRAHEFVFMFVKSGGYYYDGEAIKEPLKATPEQYKKMLESNHRQNSAQLGSSLEAGAGRKKDGFNSSISDGKTKTYVPAGANRRSVWTISYQSYEGAHFAVFPSKLVEPCIKAGTSEHGACSECGAPYERLTDREKLTRERPADFVKYAVTGKDPPQEEAWLPVVGWERYYAVSNLGRVKRLPEGILSLISAIKDKYFTVKLSKNSNVKTLLVHQLVLNAFVGPAPDGMQCRHLDGNGKNNNIRNIIWGTRAENEADKVLHGRSNQGERHGNAKMTASDVIEMWNLRVTSRKTYADISRMFGYDENTVRHALRGEKWQHLGLGDCEKATGGRIEAVNSCGNTVAGVAVKTLGWQARCKCKEELAEIGYEPGIVPQVVLDPFIGSGTTAVVALAHGRHCIGIDLSETYLRDNAIPRIQGALLNRPGLAHLAGFDATKFDGGASL